MLEAHKYVQVLTEMSLSRVLSKSLSYSRLMAARSISDLVAMILTRTLSSVPPPCIAFRSLWANHAGAFSTHSTRNKNGIWVSRTYPDFTLQGLVVQPLVFPLDGAQVDFWSADYDAYEGSVIGSDALHGCA